MRSLHSIRLAHVYGLAGRLFNTLFGSQDGDQQRRGPSSETSPQDPSESRQGHAQAGTETAVTGTHASAADNIAEAGSADDAHVAIAQGSAAHPPTDNQTGYGGPSNRPATHAGFAPGMPDMPLYSAVDPAGCACACACVLLLTNVPIIINATACSGTSKHRTQLSTEQTKPSLVLLHVDFASFGSATM